MTTLFIVIGVAGMMGLVARMAGHHQPLRHKVEHHR